MAWIKTHSTTVSGISPETIWKIWSNMEMRTLWDTDTEWATIEGPFKQNAIFYMKPFNGPKIKMEIAECIPNQRFTDCFKVPFAQLYGIHEMEKIADGLRITTTIKVEGALGWFLRKIIGEKIAAEVPGQTETLIKLALKQT